MPDISMCNQPCPRRFECYRSEASGTKPNYHQQSYMLFPMPAKETPEDCHGWWPISEEVDKWKLH